MESLMRTKELGDHFYPSPTSSNKGMEQAENYLFTNLWLLKGRVS